MSAGAKASARVVVQGAPELTISVFDANGQLVIADDAARPMAFDRANGAIEVSKQREASELYYGFGEKALPRVQRIGFVEFLGVEAAPKRVSIDGSIRRDFRLEAATKRLRVEISADNVREILLER